LIEHQRKKASIAETFGDLERLKKVNSAPRGRRPVHKRTGVNQDSGLLPPTEPVQPETGDGLPASANREMQRRDQHETQE
jgi:hypothetical protein